MISFDGRFEVEQAACLKDFFGVGSSDHESGVYRERFAGGTETTDVLNRKVKCARALTNLSSVTSVGTPLTTTLKFGRKCESVKFCLEDDKCFLDKPKVIDVKCANIYVAVCRNFCFYFGEIEVSQFVNGGAILHHELELNIVGGGWMVLIGFERGRGSTTNRTNG